jgi:transcriptional regulator with XRE-family HTH domain
MYPNDKDKLPADGETLSNYIKRLRQQLHFSQQELANQAGIHIQSLGKLERGTRQRLNQKTKTALANVFDIPIEYLEAVSQGKTIEEAKDNLKEAMELYLEDNPKAKSEITKSEPFVAIVELKCA